jgi:hypothetical protein
MVGASVSTCCYGRSLLRESFGLKPSLRLVDPDCQHFLAEDHLWKISIETKYAGRKPDRYHLVSALLCLFNPD